MKKEFKKVLMVMSLVVLIFGFTACGIKNIFSKVSLEEASRVMTEELDNCDYKMNMSMAGLSMDSSGTLDIKNDIIYSKVSFFGMTSTEYVDSKNGYKYSESDSLFKFGDDTEESEETKWVKTLIIESDATKEEILSFVDLSEYLTDIESENEDGGKRYSGIISSEALIDFSEGEILDEEEEVEGNIELEFFVNSDNYIETIELSYSTEEGEMKFSMEFSSFNTAGDIVIPNEALNAELEETDEYDFY